MMAGQVSIMRRSGFMMPARPRAERKVLITKACELAHKTLERKYPVDEIAFLVGWSEEDVLALLWDRCLVCELSCITCGDGIRKKKHPGKGPV